MRGAAPLLLLALLALGCEREPAPAVGTTAPGARAAGDGLGSARRAASLAPGAIKGSVVACAGLPLLVADDHGDGAFDATPLPLGDVVQGAAEGPSDADWFAVGLERGRRYRVEAIGLVPPNLAVVGADGRRELVAAAPGAAELELTAPEDGVCFVRLSAPPGAPSPLPYHVRCEPLP